MIWYFVLIGLLLLPLLLLAIPVEIECAYDSQSGQKATTRIVWFFGLVRFQPGGKKAAERDTLRDKFASKGKTSRKLAKAGKKHFKVFIALLGSEGFTRRMSRLLYDILSAAKIKQLRARFLIGLDDPADTGFVYGLLSPGFAFLYAIPQVDFVATPVFDQAVFATNMDMKIRLVPINYLKAGAMFVFSKETFSAALAAFKAYRL
jgi:hypothetical protein